MRRGLTVLLPVAVALFAWTGAAAADPTTISGTVPNGGCDATRTVTVSGPSRIEVQVSSTSASTHVYGEIVAPDGTVVAKDAYDTPSGGNYGIRVCSFYAAFDAPNMQYRGIYGTAAAHQPALPRQAADIAQTAVDTGAVLGATASINHVVYGHGAIRTAAGLAWVTLRADNSGHVRVSIDNVARNLHLHYTHGMRAVFSQNSVRITGHGVKLTVVDRARDAISLRTSRLTASGQVVRGRFRIAL